MNHIELFEHLHRNPELSFNEFETTKTIWEFLKKENIEIISTDLKTGLIAVIRGSAGKTVCLRADIDALPITEQTDLPYLSQNSGVMHACGHDFHTTVALSVAEKLSKQKIRGTVYIVFEPGEEAVGGAETVLRTGALSDIDEFYGIHADPSLKVGEIGIKEGGVMAAVDRFRIDVTGVGTHAATPNLGRNPVNVLVDIIKALPTATLEIPPTQPHVLTVTHIQGGNAWNIIPETAFCEGTVRTLCSEDRTKIYDAVNRIVDNFGRMTKTDVRLKWDSGASAVVNTPELCIKARTVAKAVGLTPVDFTPTMIGDDFSAFTEQFPKSKGLYLKIGTGKGFPLHHPKFAVDPQSIDGTVDFICNLLQSDD